MKKIISVVSMLVLIAVSLVSSSHIYAKEAGIEIRVGLLEKYHKQKNIKMFNKAINMGYLREEGFVSEHVFVSNDGFLIEPTIATYLISQDVYPNYIEVTSLVDVLRGEGYKAYAGNKSKGIWKIYIEVASVSEGKAISQKIKGKHPIDFDTVTDGGYRTKMTFSGKSIIIENVSVHPQFLSMDQTAVAAIDLGDRRYRGRMEIGRYGEAGITAINVIDINDYLYSVVPSEMPKSWPKEALKAQAVVARNYAIYNSTIAQKYKSKPYQLSDTTSSQAYKGAGHEFQATNEAVDETLNVNIYYNNKIIPTNFFSTSGGHTEDSENVWPGKVGYLRGVPDIYELSPYIKPWTKEITSQQIKAILAERGENIGDIVDVIPMGYSDAGRVMELKIRGTSGEHILKKETMRYWLGLKSRKFNLIKENTKPQNQVEVVSTTGSYGVNLKNVYTTDGDGNPVKLSGNNERTILLSNNNIVDVPHISGKKGTYIFMGQGNGHGVGMSQSGARGMAEAGFTYDEILKYYYTNIEVR